MLHSHLILSQNFAPALIMFRAALGHARPDTEWSGKFSGWKFNSNPGGGARTTGRLRSKATGGGVGMDPILTAPTSNVEHEADINLEAREIGSDMEAVAGEENSEQI
jgi:hypothetical protein